MTGFQAVESWQVSCGPMLGLAYRNLPDVIFLTVSFCLVRTEKNHRKMQRAPNCRVFMVNLVTMKISVWRRATPNGTLALD